MSQYIDLDLQSLIDVMVIRTKEYDAMLSTRVFSEEEFAQCKRELAELHALIKEKAAEAGFPIINISPDFSNNKPSSSKAK